MTFFHYDFLVITFLINTWIQICFSQPYACPDIYRKRTTPFIKEIFLGRCYEYLKTCERPDKNCSQLLDLFLKPFYGKDPCLSNGKDFDDFFREAHIPVPKNKSLFWSGAYDIAHTYSNRGKRYITLEDTLIGYLLNQLSWCGQKAPPYFNFDTCDNNCSAALSEDYWSRASKQFAESATGYVTVILNGSRETDPAFKNNSYFARFELPSLIKEKVHTVKVLIAYKLDGNMKEKCGTGSLQILQKLVKQKGFSYECIDNYEIIKFLLCADNPQARECLQIIRLMTSSGLQRTASLFIFIFILLCTLLVS